MYDKQVYFGLQWLTNTCLGPVYTEFLAITMQKWVENFAKEWVDPFLAMPANAQCERTLTLLKTSQSYIKVAMFLSAGAISNFLKYS